MLTTNDIAIMEGRIRAAGLAIDEFCARAGIDRSTWQRWKAGVTTPTLRTWGRVLAALEQAEVTAALPVAGFSGAEVEQPPPSREDHSMTEIPSGFPSSVSLTARSNHESENAS